MAYNTVARRLPHADYVVKFSYHIKEKRGSLTRHLSPIKVVGITTAVTSNVDPAPIMYIFLTTPYTFPFMGRCIERVYTHTTQTSTFISFLTAFQNFLRSDRPKTRRSKRLSSICHRPPTNPVGASDTAKIITNERKTSSLLKYFSLRVQFIFYKNNTQLSKFQIYRYRI